MQLNLKNPELEAKIERLVSETGCSAEELLEDLMAGYFEELEQVGKTLDTRYDDVKSGKVQLIDGEEAFTRLRAKSEARRQGRE